MTRKIALFYLIFIFPVLLPLSACVGPSDGDISPNAFKIQTLATGIRWNKAEFSADSNRLALLGENNKIAIIDIPAGKIAYGETEIERPVYFDFSPDISELWIIDRKGNINRHDPLSTQNLVNQDDKGTPVVWQLDTQKKDVEIAASAPLTFSLKRTDSSSLKMNFNGHLILNAEGKPFHKNDTIVLAQTANEVLMWRAGAEPLDTKENLSATLTRLACNAECVIVANNAVDEFSTLWPIGQSKKQYFRFDGRLFLDYNDMGKLRPAMDLNGTKAVYSSDGKIGIVRLSLSGFEVLPPAAEAPPLVQAKLSKNENFILTKSNTDENQVAIFNANTMKSIPLPENMSANQRNAILGPDGLSFIGIGKNDEAVLVVLGSSLAGKILAKSFSDVAFRFSNSGQWFTLNTFDQGITLFNAHSGELIHFLGSNKNIAFLRFSPDDKYLAIGYANGDIKIQPPESF